jgi:DHA3 family macrolide efflux protein-like MFS transporter
MSELDTSKQEKKNFNGNVFRFLFSQCVSLFGSSLVDFALIWHITLSTKSGMMMTIATICTFLPRIMISVISGVIIDRYNRKLLIMLSDGLIAFVTLLLAICFINGIQSLIIIFVVLALRSIGTGIQTPTVNAFITQIVEKKKLLKFNGIFSSSQSLIMLVSPAISGIILSTMSLSMTFFIDVITAIFAILIMLTVNNYKNHTKKSHTKKGGYLKDLKEGINFVKNNFFIKYLLLILSAYSLLVTPAVLLCQLIVARNFGEEIWKLTINEIVFSIGTMLGGIIVAWFGKYKNDFTILSFSLFLIGFFNALLGVSNYFILFLIIMFIIGVFMSFVNSAQISIFQKKVDENMQGRIFSFVQIVCTIGLPVGMIIFGPISDIVNLKFVFIFTGLCLSLLGFIIMKSKKINHEYLNNG